MGISSDSRSLWRAAQLTVEQLREVRRDLDFGSVLYGSAACGRADRNSDADLLLAVQPPTGPQAQQFMRVFRRWLSRWQASCARTDETLRRVEIALYSFDQLQSPTPRLWLYLEYVRRCGTVLASHPQLASTLRPSRPDAERLVDDMRRFAALTRMGARHPSRLNGLYGSALSDLYRLGRSSALTSNGYAADVWTSCRDDAFQRFTDRHSDLERDVAALRRLAPVWLHRHRRIARPHSAADLCVSDAQLLEYDAAALRVHQAACAEVLRAQTSALPRTV